MTAATYRSPSGTAAATSPRSATPPSGSSKPDGLPAHGTSARYCGDWRRNLRGCRCDDCRRGYNRYRKHRLTYGPYSFDSAEVAEHIRGLLVAGATITSIAKAANCHDTVLNKVLNGQRKTVRASTRARILAVAAAPTEWARADATGCTRRLRALIAAGHPVQTLREQAGVNKQTLSLLITGQQATVTARTAQAISGLYDRLSMVPDTSVISLNRAARNGWAPPLAWTDIDDPAEVPEGWRRTTARRTSEELAEDADFIIRTTGVDLDLAAERLGVSRNRLEKARERTAKRTRVAERQAGAS